LLAGLNAGLQVLGKEAWTPARDQAYLGVMVDDLVTRGVTEPYRMFTSRAEFRLQLREDNADLRLTEVGRKLGLVDDLRWSAFEARREAIERELQRLRSTWLRVRETDPAVVEMVLGQPLEQDQPLEEILRRPQVDYAALTSIPQAAPEQALPENVAQQVEISVKYSGYIARQEDEVARQRQMDQLPIPPNLDFTEVRGLSREVEQKLAHARPETLGQASRISGVTPAAIALLLVHLRRQDRQTPVAKTGTA
jgi:tRNA uridine 5-carboxymethylaminomethyl modification enzyme